MANPAAQFRADAQARWPGASVESRGRNWIRHQHPSEAQRYSLDVSIANIHYGAGEDQEIETAWQPSAGAYDYEMVTNDWHTYARDTFNVGDLFRFERDGEFVLFDPQSISWIDENTSRQQIAIKQPIAASVTDSRIEFLGAYGTGIDFVYTNQTSQLQKVLSIDQFSRIDTALPVGNTIWFELEFTITHSSGTRVYLDGSEWQEANNVRVQTGNRIEFRDVATGTQTFWSLDYPRAWDSAAESSEIFGEMEVRRQGGPTALFLTVRIPKTWIDTAIFPIYIDPTIDTNVAASADDGFVYGTGTSFNDTGNAMSIGERTASAFHPSNAWFRFTGISGLAGATINTSYVTLIGHTSTSGTPADNTLYAEDAQAPAAPTDHADYDSKTLTTAGVAWNPSGVSAGSTEVSPSINSIISELATSYDPSAIQFLYKNAGEGSANNVNEFRTYDRSTGEEPNLYIDYTAAGGGALEGPLVGGFLAGQGILQRRLVL